MKRVQYLIISISISILFLFTNCSTKPKTQPFNGKYYMLEDSNCRSFKSMKNDRVMCYDAHGKPTGWRKALSNQELQMYMHEENMEKLNSINSNINNSMYYRK